MKPPSLGHVTLSYVTEGEDGMKRDACQRWGILCAKRMRDAPVCALKMAQKRQFSCKTLNKRKKYGK